MNYYLSNPCRQRKFGFFIRFHVIFDGILMKIEDFVEAKLFINCHLGSILSNSLSECSILQMINKNYSQRPIFSSLSQLLNQQGCHPFFSLL